MSHSQFRSIRAWLVAGAASLALTACATGAGANKATQWPTRGDVVATQTDFTAEGLAALDARMKEAVDKGQVAGVEYVLFRRGQVADYKIYGAQSFGGPALTEKTIFRIRSMTKPITGVALMQLWEDGKWELDDPVTKYVPEFANLKVYTEGPDKKPVLVNAKRSATMRELFTHTAGFGYGLSPASPVDRMFIEDHPMGKKDLKGLVDRVAEIPLLAQPGERWSYSIAIDIQGAIVERLSGMTFGEYLEAEIFKPLGMTETTFLLEEKDRARFATVYQRNNETGKMDVFPDPENRDFFKADHAQSGGGGLASTLHDYARFTQMLVNDGALDGAQILKPETVKLMMTNQIGDLRAMGGSGWGLGGAVAGPQNERSTQFPGSFSWFGIDGSWFWADPTNDIGFVGMIQRRGNGGPGAVDLRNESAALVYKAFKPS
jgi:CubicO group peptidase (beta-lactamase class C family)